jgi:hypothetical protein
MKKLWPIVLGSMLVVAGVFALILHKMYHNDNISIHIAESEKTYRFYATYNSQRTADIQHYLFTHLHPKNKVDYAHIDEEVILDDMTIVNIKTAPGKLLLTLNKEKNDFEAYARIKALGEGLKQQLATN